MEGKAIYRYQALSKVPDGEVWWWHIIIPAVNANNQQSELINVELWSRVNNLRVNPTKYAEIVFVDKRRKTTVQLPQPMPNVARVSVIKILGITFINHLSVAEHVQTVIATNSVCVENSARTWQGRRSASDGFSVCRHSQADLHLKRVVGFRNHHRPATTSGIHSTKSS